MIRRWLLWLADLIYWRYAVPTVMITDELRALIVVAESVVGDLQAIQDITSAEWKHATAYGRMVKRCPEANRRDIGLAIELAIRGL